jgi:hypothetical protein
MGLGLLRANHLPPQFRYLDVQLFGRIGTQDPYSTFTPTQAIKLRDWHWFSH